MPEHAMSPEAMVEHFEAAMREVRDLEARHFLAGEIEPITFDGKSGPTRYTDDHGSNALSYAVYNPNEVRIFVGLAGTEATASGLVIPKQKLVVAPLQVNGPVELAADEAQLKETRITILRVRFPNPQPFFVGALV